MKHLLTLFVALLLPLWGLGSTPLLDKTVTLHLQNQPLEAALAEIAKQTDIRFSYCPQVIGAHRSISIDAKNVPVKDVLEQLLGNGYEYKVSGKFAILRRNQIKIEPIVETRNPAQEQVLPQLQERIPPIEVKNICLSDSGNITLDCLIGVKSNFITNKTEMKMKKQLTALALASAMSASAVQVQPETSANLGDQLNKAGKDFVAIVVETTDATTQAVKTFAEEVSKFSPTLAQNNAADTLSNGANVQNPPDEEAIPPATQAPQTADKPQDSPAAVTEAATPAANSDSVRPIIFTIFYPFSFPELHTERYTYDVALNWFCGLNGGVNQFEVGWIANINRFTMHGVQVAGATNISLGEVTGVQVAGAANLAFSGNAKAQIAGITNIALEGNAKTQITGVTNAAKVSEVQIAGCANGADTAKVQMAGIVNTARQADVQMAGVVNAAKQSRVQLAGVVNGSLGRNQTQLAGIVNAADTAAVQIAGIVNVARHAGTQIGLVNVADTVSGVSIGLLNVVRRGGLHEFEVGAHFVGSHLNTPDISVAYRIGMPKFYTFATITQRIEAHQWMGGIGIGTQMNLAPSQALNIEIQSQHLIEQGIFTSHKHDQITQFRVLYTYRFAKYFALYGGPSLYVYTTNTNKLSVPYTLFSASNGSGEYAKGWVGFSVGVRL